MPEVEKVIEALKAQLAAQEQIIVLLKWALGGVVTALVAVSGFFVAWVRTLYDSTRETSNSQVTARDALLERVLSGLATIAEVLKRERGGT